MPRPCFNFLVRPLSGVLVLLPLVALIGECRIRVDEPDRWTVKAFRRRSIRLSNDRLVIRNAEVLDDVEILIGPR